MDKYTSTLKECSKIAKEEYKEIKEKLGKLKKDLTSSQQLLVKTIFDLDESDINDKSVYKTITDVNRKTSELLEAGFQNFSLSFEKKSANLADFTITLFGRTKAGKSTIREALTNGDGSTIGKGAQRTTRDVKIYHWNNLRILDTPGFDAYEGDEDTKIAFSQIDETDIILFLVTSDNIEESEFEKLAMLRRENKPVIILLNVLYDLKHPVKRKVFLKEPEKFVSKEAITGHLNRLTFLSKKHFDIQNIPVIPIHALAAYESTQATGEEKDVLYKASNFKHFSDFIMQEIETSGKQKRILSFRDSYIFHLEKSIKPVYEESYNNLKPLVKLLRNKQFELKKWFDKFIPDKNDEIEREVEKLFAPLFHQLDSFVDENIDKSDFGKKWSGIVDENITEEKLKSIQERIIADMNSYLEEFFKEFKFDLNLSISKVQAENLKSIKKGSGGRVLRWTGAAVGTASAGIAAGIASAIAAKVAIANFWNPLGWGLAAVAVGLGFFSWFWGDDTKRFNDQKSSTKTHMSVNLEKMQRKYQSSLKTWFYADITHGLKKKISSDLYNQVALFQKLLDEYLQIVGIIDTITEKENIDLIKRLLRIQNPKWVGTIFKAVRVQGIFTKLLVEKSLFEIEKDSLHFNNIFGEKIIQIKEGSDRIKILIDALNTNTEELSNVIYLTKEKKFIIKVKKRFVGKIFGLKGINIQSAEKITNYKIEVEIE
jgi:GTP-binding protein EngB required for normal cell division/transcription antitermination factor NusA-like protein